MKLMVLFTKETYEKMNKLIQGQTPGAAIQSMARFYDHRFVVLTSDGQGTHGVALIKLDISGEPFFEECFGRWGREELEALPGVPLAPNGKPKVVVDAYQASQHSKSGDPFGNADDCTYTLDLCMDAMRAANWTDADISAFRADVLSGDLEHTRWRLTEYVMEG
jgi:hypothetical protein